MKILKKINKGLILTIIVLLALIIYLAGVEKQRKEDKQDIVKACEEFISFTNKYTVLPEEMQKLKEPISKSKVEEYKKEMKNELEKLMIQNEEAVKIQYQVLERVLTNGYNKQEVKTKQERKINKITGYEFDGDQVTVQCQDEVETSTKYLNGTEEQTENKSYSAQYDEIILQKVDGKWKIVYSNLQFNDYDRYYGNSIEFY